MSPPHRPMPALPPARSARVQRRALRGAAWTGDPKASAARPEHRHPERVQQVQRHRHLHPGPTRRELEWPAVQLGCRVGVVELVAEPQRGRTAAAVAASAVVRQPLWSPRSWRVRTLRLASAARPRRQRDSRCLAHSASTANPTVPTADSSAYQRDPAMLGRKCRAHSARTRDRQSAAVRGVAHPVPVTQGRAVGEVAVFRAWTGLCRRLGGPVVSRAVIELVRARTWPRRPLGRRPGGPVVSRAVPVVARAWTSSCDPLDRPQQTAAIQVVRLAGVSTVGQWGDSHAAAAWRQVASEVMAYEAAVQVHGPGA
jgi:hypothetical protein